MRNGRDSIARNFERAARSYAGASRLEAEVGARMLERLVSDLRVQLAELSPGAEALRRADLLLHCKYNDPSPGLVVEAMACGTPVVALRDGGLATAHDFHIASLIADVVTGKLDVRPAARQLPAEAEASAGELSEEADPSDSSDSSDEVPKE